MIWVGAAMGDLGQRSLAGDVVRSLGIVLVCDLQVWMWLGWVKVREVHGVIGRMIIWAEAMVG